MVTMVPVVVLALCVTAALSAPSLDPQLDQHWDLWKDWHSKKYHEVMCVSLWIPFKLCTDQTGTNLCVCVCGSRRKRAGGEWCGRRT